MDDYIKQLIDLLKTTRKPFRCDQLNQPDWDDIEFNTESAKAFINGKAERISQITGIEAFQFPPADKLSLTQVQTLFIEIEDLLKHYNMEFIFPENVPVPVRYQFIIDHWQSKQKVSHTAMVQIETCRFDENKCPFPEFCSICNDFKDKKISPSASLEQLDFNSLIPVQDTEEEERIRNEVEKVKELIRRPINRNYIEGIHNYCDGRCHKCQFTDRCSSYAINQELDNVKPDEDDLNNDHQLVAILKATCEIIEEELFKRGINIQETLNDLTPEEYHPIQNQRPIATLAESYAEKVKRWLDSNQLEVESHIIASEDDAMHEALETITWFQLFIPAKITRALSTQSVDTPNHGISDDANGSAKAAILAVDESLQAWQAFLKRLPHKEDGILNLLKHLAQLKNNLKIEFPDALHFIRLGLDETNL